MQATEELIRNVVQQVLQQMGNGKAPRGGPAGARGYAGRNGVFTCVDEAVAAATEAFEQLSERSLEDRKRMIDHIRRISIDDCVELGTMEMNETKIGR
ncbi:MAG TPA: aldehyde dehydrogenase EutE, partial [Pirellulales bacterium]|nr:aldehyde dehydrogenase EutE [Pirellulales bacterium]